MKIRLYKNISMLILGVLIGSSATNLYIGYQLDNLSIANKSLRQELQDEQFKLHQYREQNQSIKKYTIDSIDAFLMMESLEGLTDHDKMSLELECNKIIKELLQPLIGQEISEIDSLLVPKILDNREIEANGNKYKIQTNLIVLNKKTLVYLKASHIKNDVLTN